MRTKHNARITITYSDERKPFNIFLSTFGHPADVRTLCKKAMRGLRRQIMQKPEDLAVNIIAVAARRTQVNIIDGPDRSYAFTYHIDLVSHNEPRVTIISALHNEPQVVNLFRFVGPEVRLSKKTSKPRATLHKKLGRATALSKLSEPLPDRFK